MRADFHLVARRLVDVRRAQQIEALEQESDGLCRENAELRDKLAAAKLRPEDVRSLADLARLLKYPGVNMEMRRLRPGAEISFDLPPGGPLRGFRYTRLGEKVDDPIQMYLNDVTTIPVNLAGVPGISIPSGLADEDGLPVGIQFVAPARHDARLYRVGAALEALLVDEWGGPLLDRAPRLGGNL